MEELLRSMAGQRVDVVCSNGTAVRGEIAAIEGGLLQLTGEDGRRGFVSTERISAIWEIKDSSAKPGFLS